MKTEEEIIEEVEEYLEVNCNNIHTETEAREIAMNLVYEKAQKEFREAVEKEINTIKGIIKLLEKQDRPDLIERYHHTFFVLVELLKVLEEK